MEPWWHLDMDRAVKELGGDLSAGLSAGEVSARIEKYGRNQLGLSVRSPVIGVARAKEITIQ